MRKILIFSTNFLPNIGGAELAVKEIAQRTASADFFVLTARLNRSLPSYEDIGGIKVYRLGFGTKADKFLLPITATIKAVSLHRKHDFDICWSMMASQASVAAAIFKLIKRRVPLLLTLQEGDEEEYLKRYVFGNAFLYGLLIRPWHTLVFKVSDRITVISRYLEERARKHNISVPIHLVPNGADLAKFSDIAVKSKRGQVRASFGFKESDWVVTTASRLVKKNRVEDIISAISMLPADYKLLIIGKGEMESELKNKVQDLNVKDRVIFVGEAKPDDVPVLLSAADVFARPSASEGFGSAFIEAMAARLPVIATQVGGISDFIEYKRNGIYCGIGDPKDLALKIQMLRKDSDLRNTIVENAYNMVKDKYQWSTVSEKMKPVFEKMYSLKKERILIIANIYPPDLGGPAKYAKELNESMGSLGYTTKVVAYRPLLRFKSGIRHFLFFLKLLPAVYMSDWILALDTFSAFAPLTVANIFFGRKIVVRVGGDFLWESYVERTRNAVTIEEFYGSGMKLNLKEKMIFNLTGIFLRRAYKIAFTTAWQRDIWMKPYRLSNDRISIVENYYGPKLESKDYERKNFIFAGRSRFLKNLELLKESFSDAEKAEPEIILDVLILPHAELMKKISSCYAVILPSLSEVGPNFILEAIQFGKPFILTAHNGVKDRIGNLGIFIEPTRKELTKAILDLSDERVYEKYRRELKPFSFVRSWDRVAEDFVGLFRS